MWVTELDHGGRKIYFPSFLRGWIEGDNINLHAFPDQDSWWRPLPSCMFTELSDYTN